MPRTLEEIAALAKSQLPKKAEARDAAPAPSAEKEKTKDEVKKADEPKVEAKPEDKLKLAEEQVKKDEAILSKKEEELTDVEKGRKAELSKVKVDDTEKKEKSNVQKRIDELTSKIKELESDRNSTKSERDELKAELDGIKKQLSMTPQDKLKQQVKKEIETRKQKYLTEDQQLPREERREMPKDQLDEWLLEDYEGASEWITKRTIRRHEEERELASYAEQSVKAEKILEKQNDSARRTYDRHPELRINERQDQLIKEGKSKAEVLEILCKENPKYATCVEIYKENPSKYMLAEDGPELIVSEMEKRLKKSDKPVVSSELEAIRKELAEARAEVERLKNLDAGITSNRGAEPKTPVTEIEKKQAEFARKVGLDPERLKKRVELRKSMGLDV